MNKQQHDTHSRLWVQAQTDTGQGLVVRRFLLNLFDWETYKFDLADFRWVDDQIFTDCMSVLDLEHCDFGQEVHERLGLSAGQFLRVLGEG